MQILLKKIPKSIYLLLSILLFAFVLPVFDKSEIKLVLYETSYSIMLLSIFSIIDKKTTFLKYLILLSVSIIWLLYFTNNDIIKYLSYTFSTIVLTAVTGVMIYQIVNSKFITARVIIETICGYLLLGIILFFLNSIVLWHNPQAISFGKNPNLIVISDLIYYSYITITTIGYGEIIPISPAARSLSILFGVISQLYLALIIAFILGKFINKKQA